MQAGTQAALWGGMRASISWRLFRKKNGKDPLADQPGLVWKQTSFCHIIIMYSDLTDLPNRSKWNSSFSLAKPLLRLLSNSVHKSPLGPFSTPHFQTRSHRAAGSTTAMHLKLKLSFILNSTRFSAASVYVLWGDVSSSAVLTCSAWLYPGKNVSWK